MQKITYVKRAADVHNHRKPGDLYVARDTPKNMFGTKLTPVWRVCLTLRLGWIDISTHMSKKAAQLMRDRLDSEYKERYAGSIFEGQELAQDMTLFVIGLHDKLMDRFMKAN